MADTESSEKITLYFSTIPSNHEMRKGQQEIEYALQANKIDYEIKDVAASQFDKIKMRSFANDQKALPPQIVNNRQYCGDYTGFQKAMETKTLGEFLKLKRKLDLSI